MKLDEIPFKIGQEYEHWEFDLEPIDDDFIEPYDSYMYIKDDIKQIEDYTVRKIILYFQLDILVMINIVAFKVFEDEVEFIII